PFRVVRPTIPPGTSSLWEQRYVGSNTVRLGGHARYALAVLAGTDQLAVINADPASPAFNQLVARVPIHVPDPNNEDAVNVAASPDGTRAYVTLRESGRVAVIDVQALQEVNTNPDAPTLGRQIVLPPGARPYGVAFVPRGPVTYVTDWSRPVVYLIDVASNKLLRMLYVDPQYARAGLTSLAVDPDGKRLYVVSPMTYFAGGLQPEGYVLVFDIDPDS